MVGILGAISVKYVRQGVCAFAATLVVASAANAYTFVDDIQFNATGNGVYQGTFSLGALPYGQVVLDATYFIFMTATPPSNTIVTDNLDYRIVSKNPTGGPDIIDEFYTRSIITTRGIKQPNFFIFKDYAGDYSFGSIPEVPTTDSGPVFQTQLEDDSEYLFRHYAVFAEEIATGYAGDLTLILQANSNIIWGMNHGVAPSFQISVVGDYTTLGNVGLVVHTGEAGVPEPGTWALILVGLSLAGVALRRRRHTLLEGPCPRSGG